jgi:hypothetical protein
VKGVEGRTHKASGNEGCCSASEQEEGRSPPEDCHALLHHQIAPTALTSMG